MRDSRGFTMIELVVTMIVIGIMAFTVLPRFDSLSTFDAAGYADQSASLIRYAQKTAIAQRRWTAVDLDANPPTICSQTYVWPPFPNCAANCAGGDNIAVVDLPGGAPRPPQASTTLGPPPPVTHVYCFDATGQPYASGSNTSLAAPATLDVYDNGTLLRTITVQAVTGYVH